MTDPSGAVVTNATVAAQTTGGQTHSATTNRSGGYEIGNLPPGKYNVTANAKGFAVFVQNGVDVATGQAASFNIALDINVQQEKVNVEAEGPQLDTNPANNASAVVLSGKDLEALPDDPDELQSDLEALAGPSAGPNGGQMYIDGFTAGQLPPKSSIREIRINQNPFSAEYDKLGYGRIEIFTKPGTDKLHGQFSVVGNDSAFNSRNPFLGDAAQTPYDSVIYMGNVGGPINKKASFFFDVQRRNIDEIAVVNATVLGPEPNFQPTAFQASVPNPRTRTNLSPRLDYQLGPNNTLTARYQYESDAQDNAGVGGQVLPEAGYDTTDSEHTVQISDTQIMGTKVVNETRFQYRRENSQQNPLNTGLSISVPGEFTGGGNDSGKQTDYANHYEMQNYTSLLLGKHFVKFGGRLRAVHEVNTSGEGFNGSYTFPNLDAYMVAEQLLAGGQTQVSGATQFSINGTLSGAVPTVDATVVDAGLYVQDDWKARPTLTLSYGLRFETQNAIHDHRDFAPRIGIAWGGGGGGKSAPKTVLRAGFGLFYDRFDEGLVLNVDRMNGVTEQQYVVPYPNFFPCVENCGSLTPQTQAIYRISPSLHSPYIMQSAFTMERQLTKIANLTVTYLNTRGVHESEALNVNAPTPGTPFSPPANQPDPAAGPINQYSSEGLFRQNQLITNFNIRAGAKLSLFGFYALNYAHSDTSGASNFPTDSYDLGADYGRASFDTRHRLFLGGTIGLPRAFRLSPFMVVNSGSPYNVTVGQDLNNDTVLNDRPAFAANLSGSCLSPIAACHYTDALPTSGIYTPIPINYLTGPAHFTLNLRLAKSFGFGPEKAGTAAGGGPGGPPGGMGGGRGPGGGGGGFGRGGGGPFGQAATTNRRYNLTFSVNARNILNKVNAANPIGSLGGCVSTPQGEPPQYGVCDPNVAGNFGHSVALAGGPFSSAAANRKIELQAMFSF